MSFCIRPDSVRTLGRFREGKLWIVGLNAGFPFKPQASSGDHANSLGLCRAIQVLP